MAMHSVRGTRELIAVNRELLIYRVYPVLSEGCVTSLRADGEKCPPGFRYLSAHDPRWHGGWDWPIVRET